jgi:hypothetical protein
MLEQHELEQVLERVLQQVLVLVLARQRLDLQRLGLDQFHRLGLDRFHH